MSSPELVLPLPVGWAPLHLDGTAIGKLRALVADTSAQLAAAGLDARWINDLLDEVAIDARLDDVRMAAAWFHVDERGSVVQASVTVTVVPEDLRRALGDDPSWDDRMLRRPDGSTVVRRVKRVRSDRPLPVFDGDAAALGDAFAGEQGLAEYYLAIPATGDLCLIAFTSVTMAVWPHLLTLFDAIVGGTRWEEPEARRQPARHV